MQVAATAVDLVQVATDLEAVGRAHDGLRQPGAEGVRLGRVVRIGRLRIAATAPRTQRPRSRPRARRYRGPGHTRADRGRRAGGWCTVALPLEALRRGRGRSPPGRGCSLSEHARCLARPRCEQVRLLGIEVGESERPRARRGALGVRRGSSGRCRAPGRPRTRGETPRRRRRGAGAPRGPRQPALGCWLAPTRRASARAVRPTRRRCRRRRRRASPCRPRRAGGRRRAAASPPRDENGPVFVREAREIVEGAADEHVVGRAAGPARPQPGDGGRATEPALEPTRRGRAASRGDASAPRRRVTSSGASCANGSPSDDAVEHECRQRRRRMVLRERLVQHSNPGQPPARCDDPDPQGRRAVERGILVRGESHSAASPFIIGARPGGPPVESGPVQTAGWRITEDGRGPLLTGAARCRADRCDGVRDLRAADPGAMQDSSSKRTAGRVLRRLGALEGGPADGEPLRPPAPERGRASRW